MSDPTPNANIPEKADVKNISFVKKLIFTAIIIFFFLMLGEIAARILGYKPFTDNRESGLIFDWTVEPDESLAMPHETLVMVNRPGKFKVTVESKDKKDKHVFTRTCLEDYSRITKPFEEYAENNDKSAIWLFGCSITFGYLLNDDESYPWLVQQELPEYNVVNYGLDGSGPLYALLRLKDNIASGMHAETAVFAYADFHDKRNIDCRFNRKKRMMDYKNRDKYKMLFADVDASGNLKYWTEKFQDYSFPLMKISGVMNAIDNKLNFKGLDANHHHVVTKAIIAEFVKLCLDNKIKVVIAGLNQTPLTLDMLKYVEGLGASSSSATNASSFSATSVTTADISVDLTKKEYNLSPFEADHPNAQGSKIIAEKLTTALKTIVVPRD